MLLLHIPAYLQRTGQPENGVNAAHHKRDDQERRHPPKRPKQEGIFLRIVVRCVRQIPGETPRRALMALLTGLDDVLPAQVRARIGHLLDIVSTVAVVAFRSFGIPELRDLPVIRIEIRLGDFFMTPAALVHDLELKTGLIGSPDGMCGMAIVTDRNRLVDLSGYRCVDALLELFLDPMMAPSTCGGQILRVNTRSSIAFRENAVRRVTIGAHCSDG